MHPKFFFLVSYFYFIYRRVLTLYSFSSKESGGVFFSRNWRFMNAWVFFSRESGPSTFGPFAICCSVGSSVILTQYNTILVPITVLSKFHVGSKKYCLLNQQNWQAKDWHIFQILTTIKMCQSLAYHCTIIKKVHHLYHHPYQLGSVKNQLSFTKCLPES